MTTQAHLRIATPDDAVGIAELHVKTFAETHGGGPSRALRVQQWTDALQGSHQFAVVVEECPGGRMIGFGRGTAHDAADGLNFKGELNKIYLLQEFQGRGIGRLLICAIAAEFLRRGTGSMLLFGDAKSRSNGFYERMGGQRLHSPTGEFNGGYGWDRLEDLITNCLQQ
jgi:GNAT superfamily N-acetyltransferase